jgi:hypothetical protein
MLALDDAALVHLAIACTSVPADRRGRLLQRFAEQAETPVEPQRESLVRFPVSPVSDNTHPEKTHVGPSLAAYLDDAIDALVRLRAAMESPGDVQDGRCGAEKYCEADLVDTQSAAERFDLPVEKCRRWVREGCGVKRGGRLLASIPHFRRRLGITSNV